MNGLLSSTSLPDSRLSLGIAAQTVAALDCSLRVSALHRGGTGARTTELSRWSKVTEVKWHLPAITADKIIMLMGTVRSEPERGLGKSVVSFRFLSKQCQPFEMPQTRNVVDGLRREFREKMTGKERPARMSGRVGMQTLCHAPGTSPRRPHRVTVRSDPSSLSVTSPGPGQWAWVMGPTL